MKIALMGTRGIPASYSGFETCVEQLGKRLVARGHDVTVYCRSHHIKFRGSEYLGMKLVKLPTVENKYLETLVHTLLSSLHSLGQGYDVVLYFIVGNSPTAWIPRLAGSKTILNVDGLDWKREKWPSLAKAYIRFSERLATSLPNQFLTDSREVQKYYVEKYGIAKPPFIAYGSEVVHRSPGRTLERYNLVPDEYILFVGRLVPENKVDQLVEAYRQIESSKKCVIVGDASYASDYRAHLEDLADGDPRIVFTGYLFGEGYEELGTNAHSFVETSAVGGTHPAIVEAMAFGNAVIVNNTPENLETIGEAGLSYDGAQGAMDLKKTLERLLSDDTLRRTLEKKALQRATTVFNWEEVTDEYERLFFSLLEMPVPSRLSNGEATNDGS
jgi:glycosyltransferase involved in cell wall biosynthesis